MRRQPWAVGAASPRAGAREPSVGASRAWQLQHAARGPCHRGVMRVSSARHGPRPGLPQKRRRPMRYAIATETWPPEVNGVALTVHGLAQGLRARGHGVVVARPRQPGEGRHEDDTRLLRSLALPRYPGLRLGLPAASALRADWRAKRPDALYVATEGPLGWSALRVARKLGIPVATGFHTRFDTYMRDYGAPPLESVAMGWMRRFHNGADATLVPTRELQQFLLARGFRNVLRLPRAVDTTAFAPRFRDEALRTQWGADAMTPVEIGRAHV